MWELTAPFTSAGPCRGLCEDDDLSHEEPVPMVPLGCAFARPDDRCVRRSPALLDLYCLVLDLSQLYIRSLSLTGLLGLIR